MADTTPAVATPEETQTFRSAQEKEWNTYVAVQPISFNGSPAYNPGDPVPVSNVERYGYEADGLVVKITTKAGTEAIKKLAEAATAQPTVDQAAPVSLNVSVPSGK